MLVKCEKCEREFDREYKYRNRKPYFCSTNCAGSRQLTKNWHRPVGSIGDSIEVKVKIDDLEVREWLRKKLVDSGHLYTENEGEFQWREVVDRSPLPPPLTESQEEELKLILTVFYRNEEI